MDGIIFLVGLLEDVTSCFLHMIIIPKCQTCYYERLNSCNEGGPVPYHTETIPWICTANRWIGFYMIGNSVVKELTHDLPPTSY